MALAAVVHSMALQTFYGHSRDTSLQITASASSLREVLERAKKQWRNRLPGNPDDLWTWCLEQPQDTLLGLLAGCTASTVNAVQTKGDRADHERFLHADSLAAALRLDMAAWFTPLHGTTPRRPTLPPSPNAKSLKPAGCRKSCAAPQPTILAHS